MNKSGFSYVKVTAVAAVLAMTLISLSGLLSVPTRAQDNETAPPREIDLRTKLKDKNFDDGRRVEIHALSTGEKIVAEVKNGKFVNLFLVASDGTEVKGVVKKDQKVGATTTVCVATITTTTRERKGLKMVTITTHTVVEFPCVLSPNTAVS
jgi:hypothetical protein